MMHQPHLCSFVRPLLQSCRWNCVLPSALRACRSGCAGSGNGAMYAASSPPAPSCCPFVPPCSVASTVSWVEVTATVPAAPVVVDGSARGSEGGVPAGAPAAAAAAATLGEAAALVGGNDEGRASVVAAAAPLPSVEAAEAALSGSDGRRVSAATATGSAQAPEPPSSPCCRDAAAGAATEDAAGGVAEGPRSDEASGGVTVGPRWWALRSAEIKPAVCVCTIPPCKLPGGCCWSCLWPRNAWDRRRRISFRLLRWRGREGGETVRGQAGAGTSPSGWGMGQAGNMARGEG